MNDFIARYGANLNGVLSGFDRLGFRGDLPLTHEAGMKGYLWAHGLGLKDFGEHTEQISRRTRDASLAVMESARRPVKYLNSGKEDKQQMARAIATTDSIVRGPLCALTAVMSARLQYLVSVFDSHLQERTRVAGTANGTSRNALSPP